MPYGEIPARTLSPTRSQTYASPPGNWRRPPLRAMTIWRRQRARPPAEREKSVIRHRRPGSASDRANTIRGASPASPDSRDVPPEVVRQPLSEPEIALAGGAVAPRRREFGDLPAADCRLHGQLERELEAGRAFDLDRVEEPPRVELEVVRGIVR